MNVSTVVMSHPRREAQVTELLGWLDAPATVVWDEQDSRWETGRRSLLAYEPDATHVLVIQDDSIPCRDFVAAAHQVAELLPETPVSFYVGKRKPEFNRIRRMVAENPEPAWLVFEGPWWGVCCMFPTSIVAEMVERADRETRPNYDKRLSLALGRMGVDCYYTLPSLVDHRLDGPSMVDGRQQNGRCAHRFIGADVSALTLDFANMPVRRYPRGTTRNRSDLWVIDTHRGIRRYCCRRCDYTTHAQSQIARHVQRHPSLVGG